MHFRAAIKHELYVSHKAIILTIITFNVTHSTEERVKRYRLTYSAHKLYNFYNENLFIALWLSIFVSH